MNDTRLIHILDAIAGVDAMVADVLDGMPQGDDRDHLDRARTYLSRARWFTTKAARGMACNHGQTCRRDLGHSGAHTTIRAVR